MKLHEGPKVEPKVEQKEEPKVEPKVDAMRSATVWDR